MSIRTGSPVTMHSAAATLPSPPVRGAPVEHWDGGQPESFDVVISGSTTIAATVLEVVAGRKESQVIADDNVDTVDFANNELDITGHAYRTGDGPLRLTTSNTLPAGLELATDYYAIYVGANTIQLAASFEDALLGNAVAFTDGGTGTHTISDTADTLRLNWTSVGFLGDAGSVDLTASKGHRSRVEFSPDCDAYALVGTLDTGTVTARVIPVIRED